MHSKRASSRGMELALAAGLSAAIAGSAEAQHLRDTIYGDQPKARIGVVSAGGGDVDGDGFDDFAIGAPFEDIGNGDKGKVTVYSGKTGVPILTILSPASGQPWADFGAAVAINGDFDGDGHADVVVGAPHEQDTAFAGDDNGCVRVFSGITGGLLYSRYGWFDYSIDELGTSVDFIGDLDGDGADEFAVGALGYAPFGGVLGYTGYVEVIGSKFFWRVVAQTVNTGLGASVRCAGDVNGDGVPDVVIGEPWFDRFSKGVPFPDCGRVIVCSGVDGSEIWEVSGAAGDLLGSSVDRLGDVNGDGRADIVVGSPMAFGTSGSIMALDGATSYQLFTVAGDGVNDQLGASVCGLRGDISGDGIPDVVAGAPGYDASDSSPLQYGYARTYSGLDGTFFYDYVPATPLVGDHGYADSVSGGDLDGDGFADIVIGFSHYDDLGTRTGLVDVWSGCPAMWNNYGSGWAGTLGVPSLTASGDVTPGGAVAVAIGNSAGVDTAAMLFVGVGAASIPTNAGGTLLVDASFTQVVPLAAAGLTLSSTLPNDANLYCTDIDMQVLESDLGASKKISFTRGLRMHIGYLYP